MSNSVILSDAEGSWRYRGIANSPASLGMAIQLWR